jgi:mono/diheme cytochrome c family protein
MPMKEGLVLLTCAGVLAAWALAAAGAHAQEPARDGQKLFDLRCGSCHSVKELTRPLLRRRHDARVQYLERFLTRHYAPDAAERKLISAWLATAVEKK